MACRVLFLNQDSQDCGGFTGLGRCATSLGGLPRFMGLTCMDGYGYEGLCLLVHSLIPVSGTGTGL